MKMVLNGSGAVSLREKKHVNNLKIVMAVDDLIHENAANAGVFICNKVFTLASQCAIISKDAVIDDLTTKLQAAEAEAEKYKKEAEKHESDAASAEGEADAATQRANELQSDAQSTLDKEDVTDADMDRAEQQVEESEAQQAAAAEATQRAQVSSSAAATARSGEKRARDDAAAVNDQVEDRRARLRQRIANKGATSASQK